MTDLGYIALILALIVSIYGIFVSLTGAFRRLPELVTSGRNAIYVVGALVAFTGEIVPTEYSKDQR